MATIQYGVEQREWEEAAVSGRTAFFLRAVPLATCGCLTPKLLKLNTVLNCRFKGKF